MTGAEIAQLILLFGPKAFDLIEKLIGVWSKPMTEAEVLAFTALARKSYEQYISEAQTQVSKPENPNAI